MKESEYLSWLQCKLSKAVKKKEVYLKRAATFAKLKKKLKQGAVREDGMVFTGYRLSAKNFETWSNREAYERRLESERLRQNQNNISKAKNPSRALRIRSLRESGTSKHEITRLLKKEAEERRKAQPGYVEKKNAKSAEYASRKYWEIKKDGADSNTLKWIYETGGSATTLMNLTVGGSWQLGTSTAVVGVLDEDNMASDSAINLCTQQSIKAYVDNGFGSQTEVDAIEAGAGLNADGSYTASVGSHYLSAATDLKNADELVDTELYNRVTHTTDNVGQNILLAVGTLNYTDIVGGGSHTIYGSTDIPDNAIIINAWMDVVTAFTDDGTNISTIGLGVETVGAGTEDIKNAAQITTDYLQSVKVEAGVGGATELDFDKSTPIKLTAARDITANSVLGGAATAFTAGKLRVYIQYILSD